MTSKLKCPFCGEELDWCLSCPLPTMSCPNHNCKAYDFLMTQNCWRELIKTRQDLEQSEKCCSAWETQALDYKAETIALSGKLEITTNALEEIKNICDGCRWCDSNLYDPTPSDGRRIAETTNKALKQIEHKVDDNEQSV